jgi:hypothetical protein
MEGADGIIVIDNATVASSSEITIQYITIVFSAASGAVTLVDKNGKEITSARNGAVDVPGYIHMYFGHKTVQGFRVTTWTNMSRIYIGLA